ncbi:restriction endonuclease subunit S [Acinetobacter johnsonii]|uniref:Restriction endonuclease subunit S n=1 Tax=Acinetobacter johnsonii TaxID=40214 RepID=A0AA42SQI0_ACIJO|nr:restriction endonuclease subunit S [Acinetobacter johnsonii]MDH0970547.1 restriction endonuclease subunit S [Acinetobacter johnsonii]
MAKYQKYAECKDSGVEWLGEIPSHWEMWKLSHAYNEIGSGTTPSTSNEENFEGDIPWVTTGELRENIILDTKKKVSQKTIELFPTLRKYPSGSVAIAMYGATIGRLGILGVEATTNQACCVMTTSKVLDNKYLFYWLQAFKNEIIQLSSGGGQPNINQEKVASLKISAPLVEDQVTIVNFLDHETAKIDSLISKQEKLIELLKEKRQAVISHAVTKGLDPNVPMKDSGVEWLGQVPEHWEVRQLRYLGTCQNGINIGAEYFGSGSPFISYGDVYRNPELPTVFDGLVQSTENDRKIYSVRSGDVLFTRTSETIEEIGFSSTCLNDVKNATFAGFLIRFRPVKNTLLPEYSKFYFRNILLRAFFVKEMNLVTRASLSQELLKKLAVPFPSLEEQKKIADFLHSKDQIFDKLINDCKKQIELLKERRIVLISSAVTGKIDIRDWQNSNNNNEAKMEFST